jgi:hypothetical protein
MRVVIIGSGVSAVIVAKTFLEYNYKVFLIDSENALNKDQIELRQKKYFLPDIKKSPKFQNKKFIASLKKFKKKYKIKTKNFFLASGLISGGLSNFWGAGLETPNLNYLKNYSFGKSILKEKNYINRELRINKNRFSFFDFFFKQKIIKKMLKKENKSVYFSKHPLAVRQYDKKKISPKDYDNLDLLSSYNKYVYNARFQIPILLKNKNFNYIPNTFIENIKREKKSYRLVTDKKKLLDIRFNKLIISAGTVGSTILADRILNASEKYQLFHTPNLKLMYFTFLLPFKFRDKIKFGIPLLGLNIHVKNEKFTGTFIHLNNLTNKFFGISKLNILFTFIKKYIFVGNIFLPPNYSNTFINVCKNKTLIYSNDNFNKKKLVLTLKRKLNSFLYKFNLLEFSSQNLKFLENGSDVHYTSTLVNKYKNGKKIINDHCELNGFKNIHILDGSSIKEGLYYPTYFLMMHARFIAKKIISNEKKNKNKH